MLGVDPVGLVEDDQSRHALELKLHEQLLRGVDMFVVSRVRGVDHMEDEVGVLGFLEGGSKGGEQVLWQVTDEAHGVREDQF